MSSAPPPQNSAGPEEGSAAARAQETDALLVGRMQAADEGALSALYDRWVNQVYSVAVHILGCPDDADDVVERTFSQLWRDAGRYDPARGSVGSWIIVIARSHALTRRRGDLRRGRHDELRAGYMENEGAVSAASPLQQAEASEDRERVQGAVGRLPEEQQRVVRMAYFDGLSQTEIAERLGVPLGTVKTRVRLAIAK
ncbi:MAG: sigma-70 family RNA polymerase sigma factor, partial [Gemmatimonadetes bacterium]|nr:sigma-70 family RNA polymerase sigma factor [Gemmatimonadota bacterium]